MPDKFAEQRIAACLRRVLDSRDEYSPPMLVVWRTDCGVGKRRWVISDDQGERLYFASPRQSRETAMVAWSREYKITFIYPYHQIPYMKQKDWARAITNLRAGCIGEVQNV